MTDHIFFFQTELRRPKIHSINYKLLTLLDICLLLPKIAGTVQMQLATITPSTAPILGSTSKAISESPTTCISSKKHIHNCSFSVGMSTFLKKQMRTARKNAKSSGKAKAKIIAQVHAIRSSSIISDM